MSLKKTKFNRGDSGFTIVELLVVIVVIAILAAITIVSYTNVTTKAKAAQAQANGNSVQQVAESYNADAGYYPKTLAALRAGFGSSPTATLPTGITLITGQSGAAGAYTTPATDPIATASTTTDGPKTISYACAAALATTDCSTISPAGARIEYWDYGTGARAIIYVGTASAASNFSITGLGA